MKDVIEAAHALREQGMRMLLFHWVPKARFGLMPPAMDRQTTVSRCRKHRWRRGFYVGGLIYGLLMRESSEHTLRLRLLLQPWR